MTQTANPLAKYPPVPRYTSYPTAPHFYPLPEGARRQWLAGIPEEATVSLYLHLPYCAQQCWYCGCNTRISRRYEPVQRYLDHLCREVDHVASAIGRRQKVGHIHFGGGSPSLLSPEDFRLLMAHLAQAFDITAKSEIAIELDPRSTDEAKLTAYAAAGVNRLSIGVQDSDPAVQMAINRIQPFSMVESLVRQAKERGMQQHSFDLVYGLPAQTLAGFKHTLEEVLHLRPGRLALFGYAHVPWMKKGMRLIDENTLPDATLRCAMVDYANARLAQDGYVTIGLDHYALPEDALAKAARQSAVRRNFQGYGTDPHEVLIGLGASAISHLPQGYVQNPSVVEAYVKMLEDGGIPQQKGFQLTPEDRLRKRVIDTLMCDFTADTAAICLEEGMPASLLDASIAALSPLIADGLVTVEGRRITVSPTQRQAVRLACAAFDGYYTFQPNRHAQVA